MQKFYVRSVPLKCTAAASHPKASDLIYLFKEGIEESRRAVTSQAIYQCKGQSPLEKGVILSP